MVDMREGGGRGGRGSGRVVGSEGGRCAWEGNRHVGCDKHVIGLDCGADEEAAEGEDGKSKAAGEVLIDEGLRER